MRFWTSLYAAAITIPLCTPAQAANYQCELVDQNWRWFSDHVALYVTYIVVGQPGRTYEVGTGVSISGKPRGKTQKQSGAVEVTAYGLGALHIRQSDSGNPFKVCATSEDIKPIKIISAEF